MHACRLIVNNRLFSGSLWTSIQNITLQDLNIFQLYCTSVSLSEVKITVSSASRIIPVLHLCTVSLTWILVAHYTIYCFVKLISSVPFMPYSAIFIFFYLISKLLRDITGVRLSQVKWNKLNENNIILLYKTLPSTQHTTVHTFTLYPNNLIVYLVFAMQFYFFHSLTILKIKNSEINVVSCGSVQIQIKI